MARSKRASSFTLVYIKDTQEVYSLAISKVEFTETDMPHLDPVWKTLEFIHSDLRNSNKMSVYIDIGHFHE